MTLSTFLVTGLSVVAGVLILRFFWVQIALLVQIVRILFYITVLSIISASIWSAGIRNDYDGINESFWVFFMIYCGVIIVVYCIISDLIGMGIEFIRSIFKIK